MYIDYSINPKKDFDITDIMNIFNKLDKNKNKICNDNSLKNYEKILLLIELYSSKILLKEDGIINYLHLNNIDKFNPLYYAYDFLIDFITKLDNKSNFYYPILLIDSGKFCYNLKKNDDGKLISTFGFNMLSLNMIKAHLKNMIPNIIILSKNIELNNENKTNNDGGTNYITGNSILNISNFKNINIDKNELEKNNSKHYGFIISRIFIHELFGHKKSSYSQNEVNNRSVISFKDEFGNLKYLSDNIDYVFKDKNNIDLEDISEIYGESGYFVEYYLGKIEENYTCFILDYIEDKTNLGVLLDAKIWHKELSTFNEYVALKCIMSDSYKEVKIDNSLDIYEQIKKMKQIIDKDIKKDYKDSQPTEQNKIDNEIFEKFNDIIKKRKSSIFTKNTNTENKKIVKDKYLNLREYIFKYGFYKK